MIYPYLTITPTIRRPLIEIILKSKKYFVIYPVLIDSGADYCIFSLEVAKILGIKLSKTKTKFKGIGKDQVVGRWGDVEIKIGSNSYQTHVLFAEISQFSHGILGQRGFFDHFDVKLSHSKQTIDIEPVKLPN